MRIGRESIVSNTGRPLDVTTTSGAPVDDELTTPAGNPLPSAPATTEDVPRAAPSAESKEGAQARFKNDPRAKSIEHRLNADVVSAADKSSATDVGAVPGPRPAASDFKSVDAGIAALEKDFGVHVVRGGWSAEELSRVHEAWSKMTPAERENLKGLDLKRESEAPPDVAAANKGSGTVAGLYEGNVEANDGKRVKNASITYYDAAFPKPENTGESRRASMQVILHEAGHAVEKRGYDEAIAATNAAVDPLNGAVADEKSANSDANAALGPFNASLRQVKTAAQRKEASGVVHASGAYQHALGALDTAKTPAQLAKANAALDKAQKALDDAVGAMSPDNPAAADASDFAQALEKRGDAGRAYGEANVAWTSAKAKENALGAHDRTKTLADFVQHTRGEKAVSGYGSTAPDENFAEAFALYRRDPDTLKASNPKTYAWFAKHYP